MPTSPDVTNVKLGACTVKWGTDDLGYTKGGVEVSIATSTKEVMVDQYGESPVNEYIQGRQITVKVPMAESDLNKLALVIPGATLVVDGEDEDKLCLKVGTSIGTSLRGLGKKLILHPVGVDAGDKTQDVNVTLASPSGNMDFAFNFDNERVYNVTFKGYPDNETGALFTMGDETAEA